MNGELTYFIVGVVFGGGLAVAAFMIAARVMAEMGARMLDRVFEQVLAEEDEEGGK